jgi:hypothetical protein
MPDLRPNIAAALQDFDTHPLIVVRLYPLHSRMYGSALPADKANK